jgi:hypothetical protein
MVRINDVVKAGISEKKTQHKVVLSEGPTLTRKNIALLFSVPDCMYEGKLIKKVPNYEVVEIKNLNFHPFSMYEP